MTKYEGCRIYRVENNQTVGVVDIVSTSQQNVYSSFEDDRFKEDRQTTAFSYGVDLFLDKTGYNISIPSLGDFKITSFLRKQVNVGDFKAKYNYQWTLEG